jgi:hypothetical protein
MNLQEYYSYLKDTPLPTEPQFAAFAAYVAHAHSWYKHLDLFRGARVVVFLDPRAGGGHDEQQPRLHHTWTTRKEYVERFGHLAYTWRHGGQPDSAFETDYALSATASEVGPSQFTLVNRRETPALQLPSEITTECGFRMYPFACDNGLLLHRFDAELRAMAQGAVDHPCKDLLVAVLRASDAHDRASDVLRKAMDGERNRHAPYEEMSRLQAIGEAGSTDALNDWQMAWIRTDRERVAAWRRLFDHERTTIRGALDKLRKHLVTAGLSNCMAP